MCLTLKPGLFPMRSYRYHYLHTPVPHVGIPGSASALVASLFASVFNICRVHICLQTFSYDLDAAHRFLWAGAGFLSDSPLGGEEKKKKKTVGSRERGRADFHSTSLGGQVGLGTQRKGWVDGGFVPHSSSIRKSHCFWREHWPL